LLEDVDRHIPGSDLPQVVFAFFQFERLDYRFDFFPRDFVLRLLQLSHGGAAKLLAPCNSVSSSYPSPGGAINNQHAPVRSHHYGVRIAYSIA